MGGKKSWKKFPVSWACSSEQKFVPEEPSQSALQVWAAESVETTTGLGADVNLSPLDFVRARYILEGSRTAKKLIDGIKNIIKKHNWDVESFSKATILDDPTDESFIHASALNQMLVSVYEDLKRVQMQIHDHPVLARHFPIISDWHENGRARQQRNESAHGYNVVRDLNSNPWSPYWGELRGNRFDPVTCWKRMQDILPALHKEVSELVLLLESVYMSLPETGPRN